jgi:3D (Asp-Asp-Asp) domain-containing protein
MTSAITTALVGFFVYSGAGTTTLPGSWANQTPPAPTYQVTMTAYNAVPEQTDGNPLTTASGAFSNPDIVAARSADLAGELPFGTVISVTPAETSSAKCGIGLVHDLVGLRVIADSMHPRKHNQIDILFDSSDTVQVGGKRTNPALALGICKDVRIEVVGFIDPKHLPKTQLELKTAMGESVFASK